MVSVEGGTSEAVGTVRSMVTVLAVVLEAGLEFPAPSRTVEALILRITVPVVVWSCRLVASNHPAMGAKKALRHSTASPL